MKFSEFMSNGMPEEISSDDVLMPSGNSLADSSLDEIREAMQEILRQRGIDVVIGVPQPNGGMLVVTA
jgi:hypothetical protein